MVLIYLNSEGDILTLKIYLYHNLLDKNRKHITYLCEMEGFKTFL